MELYTWRRRGNGVQASLNPLFAVLKEALLPGR
jgi:hypothetical protein